MAKSEERPHTPSDSSATAAQIVSGGWRVALAIAALGVLLYAGSLGHGFTLDDPHVLACGLMNSPG